MAPSTSEEDSTDLTGYDDHDDHDHDDYIANGADGYDGDDENEGDVRDHEGAHEFQAVEFDTVVVPADADDNSHVDETGPAHDFDDDASGPSSLRSSSRAIHCDTNGPTDSWSASHRFSGPSRGNSTNGGVGTNTCAGFSTASGIIANLGCGLGGKSSQIAAAADPFTPHNWESHFANPQPAGEVLEQPQEPSEGSDAIALPDHIQLNDSFPEEETQFQAFEGRGNMETPRETSNEIPGARVMPRGRSNPHPQSPTSLADDSNNQADTGLSKPSRLTTQVSKPEDDDERAGRLSPSHSCIPWCSKYAWQDKTPKPHEWWKF